MLNKVKRFLIATLALAITFTAVPTTSIKAADSTQKYKIVGVNEKLTYYAGKRGCRIHFIVNCSSEYNGAGTQVLCPTYKSSNTKVLKVDENGNLTPIKPGKATITMESNGNICKKFVTVKDPKKSKTPVFEQTSGFEYGKKYQIRTLNGYKVKSIKPVKGLEVFGNSVIRLKRSSKASDEICGTKTTVTFTNGKKMNVYFYSKTKQYTEALKVVKNAMADMGITSNSSELEKITAVYNWLALNTEYSSEGKHDGDYNYYSVILDKKGDCKAFNQAIQFFCEYLEIECVEINVPRHVYNGVCIDGKWYTMDGSICCDATAYNPGANSCFLTSAKYSGMRSHVPSYNGSDVKVSSKSTYKGISYDNTDYDNKYEIPFFQQMVKDHKDYFDALAAEEEARYEATKDVVEYYDVYDTATGEWFKCPRTNEKGLYLPEGYEGTIDYDEANDRYILVHS